MDHLIALGASVNQEDEIRRWPLSIAVDCDHTALALSLIEHGASLNQYNGFKELLPIEVYIDKYTGRTQNKFFFQLIPGDSMKILKVICNLLDKEMQDSDIEKEHRREVLPSVLHMLIQKLKLFEYLSMTTSDVYTDMKLNGHRITRDYVSLKTVNLCSVLLVLLGCVMFHDANFRSSYFARDAERVYHATAIGDLWDAYNNWNRGVKTLQSLCIQKTRQSMNNLADESFENLSLPSNICKFLMLHDVADVLCEAYQMWPKCMSIEDLM